MRLIIVLAIAFNISQSVADTVFNTDVTFKNLSYSPIYFVATTGNETYSDECSPNYQQDQLTVPPFQNYSGHLTTTCKYAWHRSEASVNLIKNYFVGHILFFAHQSPTTILQPGFEFYVMNYSKSVRTRIRVVDEARHTSWMPKQWSLPSEDHAGVAWLTNEKCGNDPCVHMRIAIPLSMKKQTVDVAFDKSTGLNNFGNYLVRDEAGYYVAAMSLSEGIELSFDRLAPKATIECTDAGCRSY